MLLPFPVLMRLKMQKRKKVVLLGLFGLGVFITVIQLVRILTVKRLAVYTDSAPLIMWSAVETNLGIIVACVPCLSPLFKYFRDRTLSKSRKAGGGYKDVGSQYALRTWKGSQQGGIGGIGGGPRTTTTMMRERGGGGASLDLGHEASARAGGGVDKTGSMECILEPTRIVRKTEVTITRS